MIWSIACMAKLKVMNSTIGFQPGERRATPSPRRPCSVIGVSMTRLRRILEQALAYLVGAWYCATSSRHQEDWPCPWRISRPWRRRNASRTVMWTVVPSIPVRRAGAGVAGTAWPAGQRRCSRARGGRRRFGLGAAAGAAAGAGLRRIGDALALGGENADRACSPPRLRCPRHQDWRDGAFRRPLRPPWSPCRSRFRRAPGCFTTSPTLTCHCKLALRHGRRQAGIKTEWTSDQASTRTSSTIPTDRARDCAAHIAASLTILRISASTAFSAASSVFFSSRDLAHVVDRIALAALLVDLFLGRYSPGRSSMAG